MCFVVDSLWFSMCLFLQSDERRDFAHSHSQTESPVQLPEPYKDYEPSSTGNDNIHP